MKLTVQTLTRVALFAALTALLAQIMLPLGLVPVSLGTLGVMLCGALLPPRPAFCSQLAYLLLGVVGLPVFAGFGSGLGWLAGPTGGYLLAYPLMAAAIARLGRPHGRLPLWTALLCGLAVCYGLGSLWLACFGGKSTAAALYTGVLPFIPLDLAKAALAALLAKRLRPALGQ